MCIALAHSSEKAWHSVLKHVGREEIKWYLWVVAGHD